ncbi:MAG: outer membrane beta-barrel domain-containing protein [Pseudomonadota bacterium]
MKTFFLIGLLLFASRPAVAQETDEERGGELYSVEKRHLMGSHELSFAVGVLPMDAFGKGLTLRGGYIYHFNQLMGWEILGGAYSFVLGTGLTDQLKERFSVSPQQAGELQAILHSNFVFKPLYGKLAFLNDKLLSAEMIFILGPALGFFDDESRPFGIDVGVGVRFFLTKYFSLMVDIRDYLFLPDFKEVDNHLHLSLGVSLTFGFDKPAKSVAEDE